MVAQLGLQLYSLREVLAGDYEGVLRQVAAMGYAGVETAGNYGESVAWAKGLFQSLNLQVPSAHMPLLNDDTLEESMRAAVALGCRYVVVPFIPPDQFNSIEQVQGHCARINMAAVVALSHGLRVLYHNHAWEFTAKEELGGVRPYDLMREYLTSAIGFELDTYWIAHAGGDPAAVITELGNRAPIIHVKDGFPGTDAAMTAVGDGTLNFKEILKDSTAEWFIVELDRCDSDMLEAVRKSAAYFQ